MAGGKRSASLISVLSCLLLTTAAGLFVHAPFLDALANIRQETEISGYEALCTESAAGSLPELKARAEAYNAAIAEEQARCSFSYRGETATDEAYEAVLNPGQDGVMGEIRIPSLNIFLPIAHGTRTEDMEYRCGHMYGTSVPVGGADTHAVIAAHTGLVSARLFTDLEKMKEGEVFSISVLGEIHNYAVTAIHVVWPEEEAPYLGIQPGRDLVTLYTCTPYGINDHRLLVTGERQYPDPQGSRTGEGMAHAGFYAGNAAIRAALLLAVPVTVPAGFLVSRMRSKARRKRREGGKG